MQTSCPPCSGTGCNEQSRRKKEKEKKKSNLTSIIMPENCEYDDNTEHHNILNYHKSQHHIRRSICNRKDVCYDYINKFAPDSFIISLLGPSMLLGHHGANFSLLIHLLPLRAPLGLTLAEMG